MPNWRIRPAIMALLLVLMASPATAAKTTEAFSVSGWLNGWFGADAPEMSEAEFDSIICIGSAASVGALITLVGGTAIVIGGNVGAATGTAIALPVLVSSMWAACAIGRSVTPGVLWLQRRSTMLVKQIGDAVTTKN
jgi:hypothetical protein